MSGSGNWLTIVGVRASTPLGSAARSRVVGRRNCTTGLSQKRLDRVSTQGIRPGALAGWELMSQFELRSRSTRVYYKLRR